MQPEAEEPHNGHRGWSGKRCGPFQKGPRSIFYQQPPAQGSSPADPCKAELQDRTARNAQWRAVSSAVTTVATGGWKSGSGASPGSCKVVHLLPHGGLLIGGSGNGAPPPSKSSAYAIIYSPRAETKHTSKVYDPAPLNDRLGELIRAVIFFSDKSLLFCKVRTFTRFELLYQHPLIPYKLGMRFKSAPAKLRCQKYYI